MSFFSGDINATDITVLGGIVDSTIIGGTTPAAASFTTLDANGLTTLDQVTIDTTDGSFSVTGTSDFNITNTGNFIVSVDGTAVLDTTNIGNGVRIATTAGVPILLGNNTGTTSVPSILDVTGVTTLSGAFEVDTTSTANIHPDGALTLQSDTSSVSVLAAGQLSIRTTDPVNGIRIGDDSSVPIIIGNVVSTVSISDNLVVNGDLTVNGVTTTVDSEVVQIASNYMDLNANYDSDAAQSGGFTVTYDPTTTQEAITGTFTTSVLTVASGGAAFVATDIIRIAGSTSNDGLYEVASSTATTVTIDTTPTEDFSLTGFIVEASFGLVTVVNVSVMRASTSGDFEVAKGNTVPLSYAAISGGLSALTYVTINSEGSLSNERSLNAGTNISITDNGANNTVDFSLATNVNVAGTLDITGVTTFDSNIVFATEAISVGTSGALGVALSPTISRITVTDGSTCTGTLADGTTIGQIKIIIAEAIATAGQYDLTVTSAYSADGLQNGSGGMVLEFTSTGQSVHLAWMTSEWYIVNAGAGINVT